MRREIRCVICVVTFARFRRSSFRTASFVRLKNRLKSAILISAPCFSGVHRKPDAPRRAPNARPNSLIAICSMSSTSLCCWKCVAISLISASFWATRWLCGRLGVFDGDSKLVDHLPEDRLVWFRCSCRAGSSQRSPNGPDQPTAHANRRDHHRAHRNVLRAADRFDDPRVELAQRPRCELHILHPADRDQGACRR